MKMVKGDLDEQNAPATMKSAEDKLYQLPEHLKVIV